MTNNFFYKEEDKIEEIVAFFEKFVKDDFWKNDENYNIVERMIVSGFYCSFSTADKAIRRMQIQEITGDKNDCIENKK